MLNLTVLLAEVDLAVAAKPVLESRQSLNKFMTSAWISAPEPSPTCLGASISEITREAGRGAVQPLNAFHLDLPMFFSSL